MKRDCTYRFVASTVMEFPSPEKKTWQKMNIAERTKRIRVSEGWGGGEISHTVQQYESPSNTKIKSVAYSDNKKMKKNFYLQRVFIISQIRNVKQYRI